MKRWRPIHSYCDNAHNKQCLRDEAYRMIYNTVQRFCWREGIMLADSVSAWFSWDSTSSLDRPLWRSIVGSGRYRRVVPSRFSTTTPSCHSSSLCLRPWMTRCRLHFGSWQRWAKKQWARFLRLPPAWLAFTGLAWREDSWAPREPGIWLEAA